MMSTKLLFGAAFVCALTHVAMATSGSVKAKDFDPAGLGLVENPHVDGMAMIRYNPAIAGSVVTLRMEDLRPNTSYGLALQSTGSGSIDYSNPQAFTTNWGGKGSFEVSLPTLDLGSSPYFYIYRWDGNTDPDSVNDVTPTEIRAIGAVDLSSTPAVKIKDFDAAGAGCTENPHVDGMAIVKFDVLFQGSDVYLHVEDLLPNTTYGVALQATTSVSPDFSNPLAFTTNACGTGSYEVTLPAFDLGSDPVVYIYRWDGNTDPDSINDVTPAELRAIGAVEHHHHHGCAERGCHHECH